MFRKVWALSLLFLLLTAPIALAENAPGRIMVKFKPGVVSLPKGLSASSVRAAQVSAASVSALNSKHQIYRIEQLYAKVLEIKPDWTELADEYVLIFPETEDPEDVAKDFRGDEYVRSASTDTKVHAFVTNPNDPRYVANDQYGLTNIDCPLAWDRTTGSSSVSVAVLDTGCDYNHEDLVGRINVADGYDFVNNDPDPMDDHSSSHGTTVCGVIGATTNNGTGIAGVDWACKIVPVKVLDSHGDGYMSDILQGIAWAQAKGVDVINMSFGQYSADSQLSQRCQEAYNAGIVLVAAAGNGNVSDPTYPAYYSTVLAVGAVDSSDQRSIWSGIDPVTLKTQASNYGTWVDCCAAGTSIWSTERSNAYGTHNGTSYASPFVAGLASLVKAANPGYTVREIMDKITTEADVISTDQPIGRRINAYLAIAGVVARITSPLNGAYVDGSVAVEGSASGWDFTNYVLDIWQSGSLIATIESTTTSVESGVLGTWDTTGLNGSYQIRLQVSSLGSTTEETQVSVIVDNTTPEASIYYPAYGASVAGTLTVLGTAEDTYIDHYVLEYGQGAAPTTFETIKQAYVSVPAGILGTWETSGLTGDYTIRLSVYDKIGNLSRETIVIDVQSGGSSDKSVEPQPGLPLTFGLPNPFDRRVTSEVSFNYVLSGNFETRIYVFTLNGDLIWQNTYTAGDNGGKSGSNSPTWNGIAASGQRIENGVYLYQVVADGKPLARGKLIILN